MSSKKNKEAEKPLLQRSVITNKHYKEKPWLEMVHKLFTYLS